MTTIKVTPGDNKDSIDTYITYADMIDDDCLHVKVLGPSAYQNEILLSDDCRQDFLRGGYDRLPLEKLVGLSISAEYASGELNYIEFRDLLDDELEGPCAEVKRFQNGGAI